MTFPRPARPHGLGIVGTGIIAAAHAAAIATIPGARLVAVTDVVPAAAQSFADRTGAAAEPALDALLGRDDIDVICVCVPSGQHAEIGVRAAAAGKHLVMEKPIDVTLAAADRLIAAAGAAGVALTVISQHRFDPGLIELRRLVDTGALGRLLIGSASTPWFRPQSYYDSAGWRGTWALDGGSLMNQGIHYVDLLSWIMGPVTEVRAVIATHAHEMEAEDTALAVLRFASGATGTLTSSTVVYPGFPQRLEVVGTGGTIVVEDGQIKVSSFINEGGSGPGPGTAGDSGSDNGTGAAADPAALEVASHAAQIADLLVAAETGRDPAVTPASSRATLELICAVYESGRSGDVVTLNQPGPSGPESGEAPSLPKEGL